MSANNFSFGFRPPGGSGGGGGGVFDPTNSYNNIHNVINGTTDIVTTMTHPPKFISIFDSNNNDITKSLGVSYDLPGAFYRIRITSGVAINNCKVSSYGA